MKSSGLLSSCIGVSVSDNKLCIVVTALLLPCLIVTRHSHSVSKTDANSFAARVRTSCSISLCSDCIWLELVQDFACFHNCEFLCVEPCSVCTTLYPRSHSIWITISLPAPPPLTCNDPWTLRGADATCHLRMSTPQFLSLCALPSGEFWC